MHTLALMQPYFLPYLGYWQLLAAADQFVLYDEVNYIKGGWINRNRILINGQPSWLTVPLAHASPYQAIHTLQLDPSPRWRDKLLKTLQLTYGQSPHFDTVFPLLEHIVRYPTRSLAGFLAHQLQQLATAMGIQTPQLRSSQAYLPRQPEQSAQARVVDLCQQAHATHYLNLIGGQTLYSGADFHAAGLALRFIDLQPLPYPQKAASFVSHLSIVDSLMAVGFSGIQPYLAAYTLHPAAIHPTEHSA